MLPLPNLHSELSEETRVRSRYLDLIAREQARRNVIQRSQAVASLRATFTARDFIEIETPMLQVMHGGASARPFATHSNAFDTELFLRIAPELFLKRAVVGGIDRVYEINRNFRNEGADSTHSPEFSMLEAYEAYGDYNSIADLTQTLIQDAAMSIAGSHVVTWADGTEFDLGGDWDRISMYESLSAAVGVTITPETPIAELKALGDREGLDIDHPIHGKYVGSFRPGGLRQAPGVVALGLGEPDLVGILLRQRGQPLGARTRREQGNRGGTSGKPQQRPSQHVHASHFSMKSDFQRADHSAPARQGELPVTAL